MQVTGLDCIVYNGVPLFFMPCFFIYLVYYEVLAPLSENESVQSSNAEPQGGYRPIVRLGEKDI